MIIKETNYLALFAKSFNWAGFFLPKDTYEECSKLYAFCRVLDDLADANQDLEIKKERFKELKEIFKEIETLKNNDLQSSTFVKNKVVISDMIVVSEDKKIPDVVIKDLVDGVESDLKDKIQFNDIILNLKRIINLKNFNKYKSIKPKNFKEIQELNHSVRLKTRSICI